MSLRSFGLLLAPLLLLTACSQDSGPEATVKAFFAESWDEGETAEDYLAEVKPYLTSEAFEDSDEVFSTDLPEGATITYSSVAIEDVVEKDAEAVVTVSYEVTYSYRGKTETEEQTDTLSLVKENDKWLLAE